MIIYTDGLTRAMSSKCKNAFVDCNDHGYSLNYCALTKLDIVKITPHSATDTKDAHTILTEDILRIFLSKLDGSSIHLT